MKLEKRRHAGGSVDRTNLAAALIHIISGPGWLWKMELGRSRLGSKPAIEIQS
jgi:hypothetical protein